MAKIIMKPNTQSTAKKTEIAEQKERKKIEIKYAKEAKVFSYVHSVHTDFK